MATHSSTLAWKIPWSEELILDLFQWQVGYICVTLKGEREGLFQVCLQLEQDFSPEPVSPSIPTTSSRWMETLVGAIDSRGLLP